MSHNQTDSKRLLFSREERASKQHSGLEDDTFVSSRRSASTSVTHSSKSPSNDFFMKQFHFDSKFVSARTNAARANTSSALPRQLSKSHLPPESSCDCEMLSNPQNYRQQMFRVNAKWTERESWKDTRSMATNAASEDKKNQDATNNGHDQKVCPKYSDSPPATKKQRRSSLAFGRVQSCLLDKFWSISWILAVISISEPHHIGPLRFLVSKVEVSKQIE